MVDNSKSNSSIMERHLQTTIQVIIVAIMLWFGGAVTDNGKEIVKLTTLTTIALKSFEDHENRIRSLEGESHPE